MSQCHFPTCTAIAPHDMHLFGEPQSPLAMRVSADRRSVSLWLPDGTMLKRYQPDAIHNLRFDVRAALRDREAAEDRVDWAAKQ